MVSYRIGSVPVVYSIGVGLVFPLHFLFISVNASTNSAAAVVIMWPHGSCPLGNQDPTSKVSPYRLNDPMME